MTERDDLAPQAAQGRHVWGETILQPQAATNFDRAADLAHKFAQLEEAQLPRSEEAIGERIVDIDVRRAHS